jgi:hypothetical protein
VGTVAKEHERAFEFLADLRYLLKTVKQLRRQLADF